MEPLHLGTNLFDKQSKTFILIMVISIIVCTVLFKIGLLPDYAITLLGKYVCYAILAISVDLIWGYLGILSLGHCAFFALGAYAMGMYLTLQIGTQGVYGSTLPDFMVFLNIDSLPWFWYGSNYFIVTLFLIIAIPALLAFVLGLLAFKSRVSGVYFSIITQALTYALMLAFYLNELCFGGNNGLTDFKTILGYDLLNGNTRLVLFIISIIFLIIAYLVCKYILNSRLGRACIATRDAQNRLRFVGVRVENIKLFFFILSAIIASCAGALYTPQVGIINPSEFSPLNSIEIVVCVALGGRGYLYGAVIGAILVNAVKSYFTAIFPEFWLFVLGALFILVTIFLPYGIAGIKVKKAI